MRWGNGSAARTVAFALLFLTGGMAVSGSLATAVRAEGLSGYLEYDYGRNNTETRSAGGPLVRTNSDSFTQLYNLALDRKFFPNLNLNASGIFQKRDTSFESEGVKDDTTTTTLRPYVNLNLRTPLYYAETAYSRNEERVKNSGGSPLDTVRESLFSTLYWRPDRFPDLKVQYSRDHMYDKDRSTTDTVTDLVQATSNYRPTEPLSLYYHGLYRDTELRLSDTTMKETLHNGRLNYNNTWWRRRIALGVDYNVTNQQVETATSGAGEVGLRVFPFTGLSASSDTPDNVALMANPGLIDGDFVAGAGINLGLPPPGGDTQRRNMGLDFLVPTGINTLYVWVDRDIVDAEVADAFSWRIYTSDDNQNWIFRQTVSPAIYSSTFNRFEIRFANVNARYVKVVTAPLTPVIPHSLDDRYKMILVTELQPELRKPASEVAGKQTSTFQNGSLDFRLLLVESMNLTYELTYVFTKRDPGDLVYTVSNGMSAFRQFNPVFSGRGRVSFENGEDPTGTREAWIYSASLTAVPLPVLYHSLTFSGKDETTAGKGSTSSSVLLYNNARLYEGIDANLGGGAGVQEDDTGRKSRNTQWNAGATLVPNRKVILSLTYNGATSVSSGGGLAEETTNSSRAAEADLSIAPVTTVYLFGSYRIEKSTAYPNRNTLNYSLNWSPFPDGTLHLTFYYNETIRTDDSKERSIVPSLRWYVTPRSYLNFSYQNLKSEGPAFTTTSSVYSGTARISF